MSIQHRSIVMIQKLSFKSLAFISLAVLIMFSGFASAQILVSKGKPVVASSAQTGFIPALSVDGDNKTRWGSSYNDAEWIYVDLGNAMPISRIVLNWQAAYGKAYQIQVSNDAANWTTIFSTTTGDGGLDDFSVTGTGRYVRMNGIIRGTIWGYSLWEFQVWSAPVSSSSSSKSNSSIYSSSSKSSTPVSSSSKSSSSALSSSSSSSSNTSGDDAVLYNGKTYWVSKTGDDANNCLLESLSECATIQKALSLIAPGDRVYIKSGTYIENSQLSAYTNSCSWFNGVGSLCINTSGTKAHPILISAAPGSAEDSVVIDNVNARVGIVILANDYITFRGLSIKNSVKNAIANGGQAGNEVADTSLLSIGVIIENCSFYGVTTPDSGDNIAAIGMWSTQDWIVKNNLIENVLAGSGIRAFGVINALIEHNNIRQVSSGILWKDHFIKDLTTRQHVFESEIRYNLISATDYGVLIQIRGTETPEAGDNYIHHNIISGIVNGEPAGLRFAMSGAYAQSGSLTFTNNLVDCSSASNSVGVTLDSSENAEFFGNILIRCSLPIEAIKYGNTIFSNISKSNYNLFMGSFGAVMDRYSPSAVTYPTLVNWQAALDSGSFSLGFNNPDLNSKYNSYSSSFFTNEKPYLQSASSPAKSMLPDGTNAGPYQLGSEIIGIVK